MPNVPDFTDEIIADLRSNTWKHTKSGGVYVVEGFAYREEDSVILVLYRLAGSDNAIPWARPYHEFMDGRFTRFIRTPA